MAAAVDVGKQYAQATTHTTQGGYYVNRTTTGQILAAGGQIIGFYVNSTTAGTVQLFDSPTTNSGPSGGVITPAIGMQWYPAVFLTGLWVVVGGTIDVTFFVIR